MREIFKVQCPVCNVFYECNFENVPEARNQNGGIILAVRPTSCNHPFLVYLDHKLLVRSTQILQDIEVETTPVRVNNVQMQKENDSPARIQNEK